MHIHVHDMYVTYTADPSIYNNHMHRVCDSSQGASCPITGRLASLPIQYHHYIIRAESESQRADFPLHNSDVVLINAHHPTCTAKSSGKRDLAVRIQALAPCLSPRSR